MTDQPKLPNLDQNELTRRRDLAELADNEELGGELMVAEERPTAPEPTTPRKIDFKVGIVSGARDINIEARDIAEENMTEQAGSAGLFKKIWKHGLWREYYRQKEIGKVKKDILKTGNTYAAEEGATPAVDDEARQAIIERFISDYDAEDSLQAGEIKERLGEEETDESRATAERVKDEIRELVKSYADKNLTDPKVLAEFNEQKKRIIYWAESGAKEETSREHLAKEEQAGGWEKNTAPREKELSYADNILELAKQVQQAFEHGGRLEDLAIDLEVTIGKAKAGVKTEAQFSTVDRIVEKLGKWPVTRLVNETTLAGAVAVAYSAGTFFSQRAARSKLLAFGTFGATALLGGGLAAARERVRVEEERRSHFRSMAKGKDFNKDKDKNPRRMEMDKFVYEMARATKLADDLEKSLENKDYKAVLNQIAEIESRQQISDLHKIDLISFSDPTKVEQERTRLMLLKAKAKADLRKLAPDQISASPEKPGGFTYGIEKLVDHKQIEGLLKGDLNEEKDSAKRRALIAEWLEKRRLNKLGGYKIPEIEKNARPFSQEAADEYRKWDQDQAEKILEAWNESDGASDKTKTKPESTKTFDQELQDQVYILHDQLLNGKEGGGLGIAEKNRLFAKMKNSKAFKAGVRGVITGLIVGGVAQEVGSFFKDNQEGLVEGLMKQHADLESGTTTHFTPLEFIRRYIGNELSPANHGPLHEVVFPGTETRFKLPENMHMEANPGGHSFSLYRGDDLIDQNIMLEPGDTISLETEGILANHGVVTHTNSFNTLRTETENIWPKTISTESEYVTAKPQGEVPRYPDYVTLRPEDMPAPTETVQVKPEDYIKNHGDIKQIHREFWYDNNTTAFDKNELKLGWGGVHGTGIDKEGNFVYSMKGMGSEGSFHDKFKINPLEAAKEGKLKLLLSLSKDTQAHPIEVPIDANGNAVIDPKSDIAKMFFQTDAKGQLHFVGKFAEVAEVTGVKDGVEQVRILSTDVGKGLEQVTDTVVKQITPEGLVTVVKGDDLSNELMGPPAPETITKTIIDTHREIIFDSPGDYRIDPPPIIPILGRNPLEPLNPRDRREEPPPTPPTQPDEPEIIDAEFEDANTLPAIRGPRTIVEKPKKEQDEGVVIDVESKIVEEGGGKLLPKKETLHIEDQSQPSEIEQFFDDSTPEYRESLERLSKAQKRIPEAVEKITTLSIDGDSASELANIEQSLKEATENKAWDGQNSTEAIVIYLHTSAGAGTETFKNHLEILEKIAKFKKDKPDIPVFNYYDHLPAGKVAPEKYNKRLTDGVKVHQERSRNTNNLTFNYT